MESHEITWNHYWVYWKSFSLHSSVIALEECNVPHLRQQQIVHCNEGLFGQMLLDVCLRRLRTILETQNSMNNAARKLLSEILTVWAWDQNMSAAFATTHGFFAFDSHNYRPYTVSVFDGLAHTTGVKSLSVKGVGSAVCGTKTCIAPGSQGQWRRECVGEFFILFWKLTKLVCENNSPRQRDFTWIL